jgi:hypothetical protein
VCLIDRIAAICKPYVFHDTATSDWTLLKAQRVKHTSSTSFYLQHNYIDVMNLIGYTDTACGLAHAAVMATATGSRRPSVSQSQEGQPDAAKSTTKAVTGVSDLVGKHKSKVAGSLGALEKPLVVAAVLLAGGAIGFATYFK